MDLRVVRVYFVRELGLALDVDGLQYGSSVVDLPLLVRQRLDQMRLGGGGRIPLSEVRFAVSIVGDAVLLGGDVDLTGQRMARGIELGASLSRVGTRTCGVLRIFLIGAALGVGG